MHVLYFCPYCFLDMLEVVGNDDTGVSIVYTDFSWFIFHLTIRWLVGGESPERDDYNLGRFNRVRAP